MSKTICPWARMERAQARVDGILERAWRRSPEAKRIDRLPPAALMSRPILRFPVPVRDPRVRPIVIRLDGVLRI